MQDPSFPFQSPQSLAIPEARIPAELPEEKMWDMFVYFENEPAARQFLQMKYKEQNMDHIARRVYQAAPKLIFSIKQAREYYRAAKHSDRCIQPMLLYYGMLSLTKALIVLSDPEYPTTSSVLKHGLSTRKLKRENYRFIHDEIRVQKDGVYAVLEKCAGARRNPSCVKFRIFDLLCLIPELVPAMALLYGPPRSVCVEDLYHEKNHRVLHFPRTLASAAGLTRQEFLHILNRDDDRFSFPRDSADPPGYIRLIDSKPGSRLPENTIRHDIWGRHYFVLPLHSADLPEICVHFMIMFVLGMLCRYETERWGEMILTGSSEDTFIINEFLKTSMRKYPNLILNALFSTSYVFSPAAQN